jgi:hypothetical protein
MTRRLVLTLTKQTTMNKAQTLGFIRHLLTFAGGILVAHGIISAGISAELTGALITLVGGAWSIITPEKTKP